MHPIQVACPIVLASAFILSYKSTDASLINNIYNLEQDKMLYISVFLVKNTKATKTINDTFNPQFQQECFVDLKWSI